MLDHPFTKDTHAAGRPGSPTSPQEGANTQKEAHDESRISNDVVGSASGDLDSDIELCIVNEKRHQDVRQNKTSLPLKPVDARQQLLFSDH